MLFVTLTKLGRSAGKTIRAMRMRHFSGYPQPLNFDLLTSR